MLFLSEIYRSLSTLRRNQFSFSIVGSGSSREYRAVGAHICNPTPFRPAKPVHGINVAVKQHGQHMTHRYLKFKDNHSRTGLYWAAQNGHETVVRLPQSYNLNIEKALSCPLSCTYRPLAIMLFVPWPSWLQFRGGPQGMTVSFRRYKWDVLFLAWFSSPSPTCASSSLSVM